MPEVPLCARQPSIWSSLHKIREYYKKRRTTLSRVLSFSTGIGEATTMENPNLLRNVRTGLILVNTLGLIFAFIALILSINSTFLLLVFSLSSCMSWWVQAKSTKTQGIQLPILSDDSVLLFLRTTPRHGLIAVADFILATLLLAVHIFSVVMVTGRRYYGARVITLYAIFAMLLSAILH